MAIRRGLDPITFELIRNSLSTIIDEMALAMNRTAYSPLVRDLFDFATGMCDAKGNLIAEGLVNPVHFGVLPIFVKTRMAHNFPSSSAGRSVSSWAAGSSCHRQ